MLDTLRNWFLDRGQQGRWRELPSLNSGRYGGAAVTLGGSAFVVIGGHDGASELASVEMIHLGGNTRGGDSTLLPPMSCPRHACVASTLRISQGTECLVVVGGHSGSETLNSAEKFNPSLQMWTSLPPMLQSRRFDAAGAAMNDSILLVAGGHNGKECTDTAEMFDASTRRWSRIPSMSCKRFQCAAAVIRDCFFVLGGTDGLSALDTCEAYDFCTSSWSMLPPMRHKRKGCAAVSVGNFVYVFGGHNDREILNSAEMYDQRTRQWIALPPMKYKRFGPGATVLGNRIFLVGGFDGTNWLASVEEFTVEMVPSGPPEVRPAGPSNDLPSMTSNSHSDGIPDELICPITGAIMVDPVVTTDGHSFERKAIEEWFSQFAEDEAPRSPKTNNLIERKLVPNHNLRSICQHFLSQK